MAFAAARMILKDKRRKSKEDFAPPRQRSKVDDKHDATHSFALSYLPMFDIVLCHPPHIYIPFVRLTKLMMMLPVDDKDVVALFISFRGRLRHGSLHCRRLRNELSLRLKCLCKYFNNERATHCRRWFAFVTRRSWEQRQTVLRHLKKFRFFFISTSLLSSFMFYMRRWSEVQRWKRQIYSNIHDYHPRSASSSRESV